MKEILLLSVICTLLQFKQFNTFSIQKRRTQSPSDLKNALEVLQRKRRRIEDSPLRDDVYGDLSDRYLPYDTSMSYGGEYGPEVDGSDVADQYMLANMLNTYPEQYGGYNDDNQDTTETKTPTIDELKEMFDEIDKNNVKNSEDQTESKSDQSNDKMSQQQMDELLSEAVKVPSTESKSSDSNENSGDFSPKPVSQDELKDVFKDDIVAEKQGNGLAKVEELNQEYINSDQGNGPSKKKKRMTKRDNNSDKIGDDGENTDETVLNLVQQVEQLQNKVSQLQLVEYLEDKENDYLASALKDATLAQLKNTEAYLEDEYNEIQKALDIEQVLQELKDSELDEGNTGLQPVEEKRSKAPYQDNLGTWYDEPVSEQGDDAQQRLEDFVKQYRQTYDLDNEENGLPDEETSPQDVPNMPTVEDVCPQLEMMSSNCEVAALLDIDDEARDLCNRHEICYICGATDGLSKHDCDAGFRAETVERCTTSDCIQSGAEFLWFIKQDHSYTTTYLEQCDDPCVKKYIVGV